MRNIIYAILFFQLITLTVSTVNNTDACVFNPNLEKVQEMMEKNEGAKPNKYPTKEVEDVDEEEELADYAFRSPANQTNLGFCKQFEG